MGGARGAGGPELELRLLGPLEVRNRDVPVALGGPKPRALLAVLALELGRVVSVDRLVEDLWPGTPPETAMHAVQVYVSQLRKALGDVLARQGPGYALALGTNSVDFHRFTQLTDEGQEELQAGNVAAAAGTLREALALWRGPALADFVYEPFAQALKSAEAKMQTEAGKCPKCGRPLVERFSKFGKFFGCSGHPECKYIKKRSDDGTPRPEPVPTEHPCPTCGKPMLQRMGKRGPFLGCSGYPECKTTMNFDAEGKPVRTSTPTEHVCEKCGKPMVLREGRRGPFLACTGYPKCKNAKDVDADGNPLQPIDTGQHCDKCGSAMVVKRGPRGPSARRRS
jgi:ssDNA-binding Zn-finger/Zn-ribbon topoisomerase 1